MAFVCGRRLALSAVVAVAFWTSPTAATRTTGTDGSSGLEAPNDLPGAAEWLSFDSVSVLTSGKATSLLDVEGASADGSSLAHGAGAPCDEPLGMNKLARLMIPAALVAAAAVAYLLFELRKAKAAKGQHVVTNEIAFVVGCYFGLVDSIIFSMVIPDSYDLTLALLPVKLEGSALFSGVVVGAFKAGTALGAIPTFFLLRRCPDIWRHSYRQILVVCAAMSLVGTAVYAAVAFVANVPGENSIGAKRHLVEVLIFGRVIGGVGAGIRLMLVRTILSRLSQSEDRPALLCRLIFSITLGVVVGPFVNSGVKILYSCDVLSPRCFEAAGLAGVALTLSQLGATLALRPLIGAQDLLLEEEQAVRAGSFSAIEVARRRSVVLHCLLFTLCRSVWFTGLEAATAMILEVHLGWPSKFVGLGIGAAFLVVVPIRTWYQVDRERFTAVGWMKRGLCVALVGSLVLFPHLRWMQGSVTTPVAHTHAASVVLLAGNALLFSSFLSDGLSQGILSQHLLPRELSVLNLDTVNFAIMVAKIGIGRPLGPHLTRFLVGIGGQNFFALSQVCFATFAFCIASSLERTLGTSGTKKAGALLRHDLRPAQRC